MEVSSCTKDAGCMQCRSLVNFSCLDLIRTLEYEVVKLHWSRFLVPKGESGLSALSRLSEACVGTCNIAVFKDKL